MFIEPFFFRFQPSSNEVASSESSSELSGLDADGDDPFTLDSDFERDIPPPSIPDTTSPRSNREYITSFTTTTTTTQKPHIEKGVKIIRELVEQNERGANGAVAAKPIQSLTTMRSTPNAKAKSTTTTQPLPANHKPAPFDASFFEQEAVLKTTQRAITTTVATTAASSTTQKPKAVTVNVVDVSKTPSFLNDINDGPSGVKAPSTTTKVATTKTAIPSTSSTTAAPPAQQQRKGNNGGRVKAMTTPSTPTTNDDMNFLKQVVSTLCALITMTD